MSTIKINNSTISGSFNGKSISMTVKDGKVIVDGVDVTPEGKTINIQIVGDVKDLSVDACDKLTVNGDVSSVKTQSGDIDITGNVSGDVKTMSGDIKCENIGGDVSTMSGDIKYKK